MNEPVALETVEAANALLFLQGQRKLAVTRHGQIEHPVEMREAANKSTSSSLHTDDNINDDDDDDESASDRKNKKFALTSNVPINFDDILKALKRDNQALGDSEE